MLTYKTWYLWSLRNKKVQSCRSRCFYISEITQSLIIHETRVYWVSLVRQVFPTLQTLIIWGKKEKWRREGGRGESGSNQALSGMRGQVSTTRVISLPRYSSTHLSWLFPCSSSSAAHCPCCSPIIPLLANLVLALKTFILIVPWKHLRYCAENLRVFQGKYYENCT